MQNFKEALAPTHPGCLTLLILVLALPQRLDLVCQVVLGKQMGEEATPITLPWSLGAWGGVHCPQL